jgi:hypothetical protein
MGRIRKNKVGRRFFGGSKKDPRPWDSAPQRRPIFGTNGVAFHCSKYEPVARKKAMPREDFMSHADYPAHLRELARYCRRVADASFELEAKASLRAIDERLSTMADEIERSDTLRG